MLRIIILFFLSTYSLFGYTWNTTGHKLVAQIAYDNLSPKAKQMCGYLFNIKDSQELQRYFINISIWLDKIRKENIHQYDKIHYIDLAFSKDKTQLPAINQRNALSATKEAISILSSSKYPQATKRLNLKILIHLVGDIHQPLHTTTKVSRYLPNGDLGGNLYSLKSSSGSNLHQYWDNGAGTLSKGNSATNQFRAYLLEKIWPCTLANQLKKPEDWVIESHRLAVTKAYTIRTHSKPSQRYRYTTIHIVEKQIASAGCRLASLLNDIADSS